MVTYMTKAIEWAVSRALGRLDPEPVSHDQVEHEDWDRDQQRSASRRS